eukprot:6229258-Prorocentrum_lima.AAC.1
MEALQHQINRVHERLAEARVDKELAERALHYLEAEVFAADRNRVQLEARLEATEELLRKTWRAFAACADLTTYSQDER